MTRSRHLVSFLGIILLLAAVCPGGQAWAQWNGGRGRGRGNGSGDSSWRGTGDSSWRGTGDSSGYSMPDGRGSDTFYGPGYTHGDPQSALWADNYGSGVFHLSRGVTTVAKFAITAAGTVLAGMLGAQFGTIGMVAGGAAGFFLSNWVGNKLFGSRGYSTNDYSWDSRYNGGDWGRRYSDGNYGGGFNNNGGNLRDLQSDFYSAMDSYRRALASGTDADRQTARTQYDTARNAFFGARYGNGQ